MSKNAFSGRESHYISSNITTNHTANEITVTPKQPLFMIQPSLCS